MLFALSMPAASRGAVTGGASVQGLALSTAADSPNGATQGSSTALLQENLSLHYAGMPFGSAAALLTGGAELANVNSSFGPAGGASSQTANFDVSAGLFPRRSLPLRVYLRGGVVRGTRGALALSGIGPSLAYGAALNFEPGPLPGIRLEAEEARTTGLFSAAPLADVRRSVSAGLWQPLKEQQLSFTGRMDDERHELGTGYRSANLGLSWTSINQQTHAGLLQLDRDVPSFAGFSRERTVTAGSTVRWGPRLTSDLALSGGDSTAGEASGTRGALRAGITAQPFTDQQLTVGISGDVGLSRTRAPAGDFDGSSGGGGLRAGYGRPLGPVQATLAGGAAVSQCACQSQAGTSTILDLNLGLMSLTGTWVTLWGDYALSRVLAPASRGGDRTEHHARASGRFQLSRATDLTLSAAYDDGLRQLIDVTRGEPYLLHEQAASGGAALAQVVGQGFLSIDLRHARGGAVAPNAPFVVGVPSTARALTSVGGTLSYPLFGGLSVQAQALGSWTALSDSQPMSTLAGGLLASWQVGRLSVGAQYHANRSVVASLATVQHLARLTLSRPFEVVQ